MRILIMLPIAIGGAATIYFFIKMDQERRKRAKTLVPETYSNTKYSKAAASCAFATILYAFITGMVSQTIREDRYDDLLARASQKLEVSVGEFPLTLDDKTSGALISILQGANEVPSHHSRPRTDSEGLLVIRFVDAELEYSFYPDSQVKDEYWVCRTEHSEQKTYSSDSGTRVKQIQSADLTRWISSVKPSKGKPAIDSNPSGPSQKLIGP